MRWSKQRAAGSVAVALAAGTIAAPAAAQDREAAAAMFNRGVEELKAGRFKQGCPLLAESLRIDPQAGTLFTLAQCEMKRGRSATALARYREYLAVFAKMTPEQKAAHQKREGIAAAQMEALRPEVPLLTLTLPATAPPATVVKLDGIVVAPSSLGVALALDPGEHVVSVQAPGGPVRESRLSLDQGGIKTVPLEVTLGAAPSPAASFPPAPTSSPTAPKLAAPEVPLAISPEHAGPGARRLVTYIVGSVGGAGLAVGAVAGGLALAKKATIIDNCGVGGVMTACRNQAGADAGNTVQAVALVSTIGFGVAIAGVGTAVALWLTEPKAKSGTAPARDGDTAWVRPSMLAAGREGAVVGLQGGW